MGLMTAVERRSATLVSADAAGYSRLMAEDELATIQANKVFREAGEQFAVDTAAAWSIRRATTFCSSSTAPGTRWTRCSGTRSRSSCS